MDAQPQDPDFTRPALSGVYAVSDADLDRLAANARRETLAVCRIELAGCAGQAELFRRLAGALPLAADADSPWDTLADALRDFSWLPAWGHALLFAHADDLRAHDAASFQLLLGVLDDAATFAADRDHPCFVFLALPETDPRMPAQTLSFDLDRDFVKLDDLLKLTGVADSGGAGKQLVASGAVHVDGAVELRKTCKIHAGQSVRVGDVEIRVNRG